jgi:pyruvate,water dikinase
MEQMMGVSDSLSEELASAIGQTRAASTPLDVGRLGASFASVAWGHIRLQGLMRAFYARLNGALAIDKRRLAAMRADELASYYRDLQRQLLRKWDAPIVNDFLAMIFHGVLRALCTKWIDAADQSLHNDLVRGVGGVISVEPAARLRRMAESIQTDARLTRVLQSAPMEEVVSAVARHPELSRQYAEYLDKFADRCLEELKLESPTLEDDPTTLLRCVGHMAARLAAGSVPDSGDVGAAQRAERTVAEKLKDHTLRRTVFGWVTRNARDRVRDRENMRFERTRVFGRVRRVFVEIGKRLGGRGLIADARDVFYLEVEEVLGFIEGTATTTDLLGLVAIRKQQYAQFESTPPPPDRFDTRGMVNPLAAAPRRKDEVGGDAAERRGTGCCAGIVRGRARVIRDPRGAELKSGEVLVAERTDPGWVMLFPAAAGILVERGSLLSHSAIVSRELGIPGVVSIPGLMAWIREGDEVELDGATGVVRLLRRAEKGA